MVALRRCSGSWPTVIGIECGSFPARPRGNSSSPTSVLRSTVPAATPVRGRRDHRLPQKRCDTARRAAGALPLRRRRRQLRPRCPRGAPAPECPIAEIHRPHGATRSETALTGIKKRGQGSDDHGTETERITVAMSTRSRVAPVEIAVLSARYRAGVSIEQLYRETGRDRRVLRRVLIEAGVALRGRAGCRSRTRSGSSPSTATATPCASWPRRRDVRTAASVGCWSGPGSRYAPKAPAHPPGRANFPKSPAARDERPALTSPHPTTNRDGLLSDE
jgi:hypothetical protein